MECLIGITENSLSEEMVAEIFDVIGVFLGNDQPPPLTSLSVELCKYLIRKDPDRLFVTLSYLSNFLEYSLQANLPTIRIPNIEMPNHWSRQIHSLQLAKMRHPLHHLHYLDLMKIRRQGPPLLRSVLRRLAMLMSWTKSQAT